MSFACYCRTYGLNFGSGRIIGSNDGTMMETRYDVCTTILLISEYAAQHGRCCSGNFDTFQMVFNVSKIWIMGFNLLYVTTDATALSTAMGLDGTYAMSNGADNLVTILLKALMVLK